MEKKPQYRSIKEQEEVRSREEFKETEIFKAKKWYVLYDGTATSENPYQGGDHLTPSVDERKRFLRETGRL